MSIIRLTREFRFEMAHALAGHNGPCRHIHGHSYELLVTISGLPENNPDSPVFGMVIDFKELKKIVENEITGQFDHALVLHKETAPEHLSQLGEFVGRLILVDYTPTSENMLIDFSGRLSGALPENIKLLSLKLRETKSSWAEWYACDNA
ncbi:MAG: 6-carboxytetrahydropterin synthase [Lentimicrobium sp.]|nr:6-carboxytetrahydropterin synthase [Lentimicrobium sp.]